MTVTAQREIRAAQWMTTNTLATPCLQCCWRDAAQNVGSVDHNFKMVRTNAAIIPADMIQIEPSRHWSAQQHPDPEVRSPSPTIEHGLGIAIGAACQPARSDVARAFEIDLREQSSWELLIVGRHQQPKGTNRAVVWLV